MLQVYRVYIKLARSKNNVENSHKTVFQKQYCVNILKLQKLVISVLFYYCSYNRSHGGLETSSSMEL